MIALRGRRARVVAIAALLSLCFALLLARAIDLAVLRGPEFTRQAAGQHRKEVSLVPHRGEIVDRRGELLALSLNVPSVYVRPRQLGDDRARLGEVARALRVSLARVQSQLVASPFVWLKRQALPRELGAVLDLHVPGVGHFEEPRRIYPHGSSAPRCSASSARTHRLAGLERRASTMRSAAGRAHRGRSRRPRTRVSCARRWPTRRPREPGRADA
jgi:cell division protein FtsI (penicillin-binding protein 3)